MNPAEFAQLQANAEAAYKPTSTAVTKRSRGGIAGTVGKLVHGAVAPFEYLGKSAFGSPVRQLAAQISGNEQAKTKAWRDKNIDLGLGEKGTDFAGGAKKFIGNSAQALLLPAAPAVSTVKGAAALGAGAGGAAALAEPNSSVEDVLTGATVGAVTGGALKGAGNVASKISGKNKGGTFMKNLTTQGQQAQGRVAGISAGSKVGPRELTPQDTSDMLQTLRDEGIKVGNSNNTLRDVTDKLDNYGSEISNHFAIYDSPLTKNDTNVIADNFINGLKTTDPAVLKKADILVADLKNNVKSLKDLWEFRKRLDKTIPASKQGTTEGLSNKIATTKAMRDYIANELRDVPGMFEYHRLAEIKPFVSREANRLNNPNSGIVGRILASGPVQKAEAVAGRGAERAGGISAPIATPTVPASVGQARNFATGILRQGAAAEAGANMVPGQVEASQAPTDTSSGLLDDGSDVTGSPVSASPFSAENVQDNVRKIIEQGGTQKDVAEYLANAKAFNDLTAATSGAKKPISATAADALANAKAGLSSLDTIEQELANNPGVQGKEAVTQTFNPFGITGRLTGTSNYDTALVQAKDVIARLRTGAAISNSEEARFTKMLPQPADPPETVQQKLALLRNALTTVVTRVGGNSEDLLQEAAQAAQ